jgi:hypothetical protein
MLLPDVTFEMIFSLESLLLVFALVNRAFVLPCMRAQVVHQEMAVKIFAKLKRFFALVALVSKQCLEVIAVNALVSPDSMVSASR